MSAKINSPPPARKVLDAAFHPAYNDVAPHFERMGRMLGLYSANGYDDVEGSSGGTLGDTPTQAGEAAGVEKA